LRGKRGVEFVGIFSGRTQAKSNRGYNTGEDREIRLVTEFKEVHQSKRQVVRQKYEHAYISASNETNRGRVLR